MQSTDSEQPPEPGVIAAALEQLARPGVWLVFAALFAALVAGLVLLAESGGTAVQRFDYDLF